MLTKTKALEILGDLTDLGLNVVLVAIADPTYGGSAPGDGKVTYTLDLTRNSSLSTDRINEIDKTLRLHEAQLEVPSMNVLSNEVVTERAEREKAIAEAQAQTGGGAEGVVGSPEEPLDKSKLNLDPNEAPQAQPAEIVEPEPPKQR